MRRFTMFAVLSALAGGEVLGSEDVVKVFVLAGQSNMEGKAQIKLLEHQIEQPDTREQFAHLRKDGAWVERDDVWIRFLNRSGKLTVGYGSPGRIGPELEFGNRLGDHFDEPVLLIKTAWGGKSLFRDFRPPSAGLPADEVLASDLANMQRRNPDATLAQVRDSYGHYYREMLREVDETLSGLGEQFPALAGHRAELCGLVWFQGWNDMVNADYTAAYADNMTHFIRDVRRDLKTPELPFVIGQLGVGGNAPGKVDVKKQAFKDAQVAPAALEEFRGNVAVVATDQYWDEVAQAVFDKGWRDHVEEWETVGSDYPYHYLGSVKTYCGIGRGFASAVLELLAEDS